MKKIWPSIIGALMLMMTILPMTSVKAASVTVNTEMELKNALKDTSIDTIVLGSDIETTEKINILRPLTLDGNGKTMKYVGTFGATHSTDNTVWGGIYILQVYKTTATIKNIKLTNGNAGLLINGSNVTIEGTIDVSGNGFGGIELGQGADVTTIPTIQLMNEAKIVNTTETNNRPTLWVPNDTKGATIIINGVSNTLQTGQELTLAEVYAMMPNENPKTGDPIFLYMGIGLLSLGLCIGSIRKLHKQNGN